MKIIESLHFKNRLKKIAFFIAKDKPSIAKRFVVNLKTQIKEIADMPKKYRKSYYFNDENIRDMTYHGYTIIYEINENNNSIEIIDIFNKNLPLEKY